jgi:hypothetical protein
MTSTSSKLQELQTLFESGLLSEEELNQLIKQELEVNNDSKDKVNNKSSQKGKRKAYQFIQIRVQLLGRGMTNEIMNLYVNGKRLKPRFGTLHELLNYLGSQGFQVVTTSVETEGVYTHFYTLQRELYTSSVPSTDIFSVLNRTQEGADFGDSIKNLLEFSLLDNF